jgi:hypothetical protein
MAGFAQGLNEFFFGKDPSIQQVSRLSPQQLGLQNQGIGNLMQLLQGGGNPGIGGQPGSFEPIAQRARTQFNTQTIPSLAERFTALGGQNSSAFQGALGSAASGLEEGLAAQGSQYGLQQNAQLLQLMQLLTGLSSQPGFENIAFEGQPGAGHGLFQGLGTAAGLALPGAAGAIPGGIKWIYDLLRGNANGTNPQG